MNGTAPARRLPPAVGLVAAGALLLRLALFWHLELYADEAYYWTWSKRLAFGYFDHPPLVAWMIRLATLFSKSELTLRLPFLLSGALAVVFAALIARELTDRPQAPTLAALFAAAAPMLTLTGALALPDAPAELAFTAATWLLVRAKGPRWLAFGAVAGLGLMSKYTGALLAPGVVVACLFDGSLRAELRARWMWLGALAALLVFAPCIAWNGTHHWVSFRFQLRHGFNHTGSLGQFAWYAGGLLLGVGPIALGLAAVQAARDSRPAAVRVAATAFFPLFVTTYSSIRGHVEANWAAVAYPSLCALAGTAAASLSLRWSRAWVGLSVALGLVAAGTYGLELREPRWLRPQSPPIARFHGWSDLARKVREVASPQTPLVASNYQIAAELEYYGGFQRLGSTPGRLSQFDLWNDSAARGYPVAVSFSRRPSAKPIEARFAGTVIRRLWVSLGPAPPATRPEPPVARPRGH